MNRKRIKGVAAGLVAGVALLGCCQAHADEKKPAEKAAGGLTVTNEAGKHTTLTEAAWKKLPRKKITIKGGDGGKITYEGVALVEILRHAGVPFGKHLRRPRVANYVLAEAADGYRAVYALAEIDPSMTDQVILLADRKDGTALGDGDGPYRIIVPKDKIRSRWVKQVTKIALRSAAAKKAK
jgi:hypothetical protein